MKYEFIKKIDSCIAKNREAIINTLAEFVQIPSVANEDLKTNHSPYGENCRFMLDKAVDVFNSFGFKAHSSKYGHYAVASIDNGFEKTIGLYAHGDVVPAGEGWLLSKNPYSLVIKDNHMVGRGVEDNKSAIVMSLYIPKILEAAEIKLNSNYSVFIGSAEETGMGDMDIYLKDNAPLPDICLVPDGAFPVCIGESSIFRFHALSNLSFDNILEFNGGSVYNAILDKLNVQLKYTASVFKKCMEISEKSQGQISVMQDKDRIYITALGITKHAAMPSGGKNAAMVFASYFKDLDFLTENDRRLLKDIELLTRDMWGKELGIGYEDSFSQLTFVNGMCKTRNDGRVDLSFDIRYGCSLNNTVLKTNIERALGNMDWSLDYSRYCEQSSGYVYPYENQYINLYTEIYNAFASAHSGEECNFNPYYSTGGTYARKLKNAYTVGTKAPYISHPSLNLPNGHGGVHQKDECIHIDEFLEALKIVTVMVAETDNMLKKRMEK